MSIRIDINFKRVFLKNNLHTMSYKYSNAINHLKSNHDTAIHTPKMERFQSWLHVKFICHFYKKKYLSHRSMNTDWLKKGYNTV